MRLLAVAVLLLLAAGIAAELGDRVWLFDLAAHFRWHSISAAAAVAAISVFVRSRRCLAGAILVAILQVPALARERAHVAPLIENRTVTLRILNANIHWDNKSPGALVSLIAATRPDVLVLQEVRPETWHSTIAILISDYPYAVPAEWRRSGTIVLSRVAVDPLNVEDAMADVADRSAKIVYGEMAGEFGRIRIAGHHAFVPVLPRSWRSQNEVFARLVRAARHGAPLIVAGDFNLTPYSKRFSQFLAESGLRRADIGWLWPHTWPAPSGWFYGGFLFRGFPIDHVLVSRHFTVVRAARGPDIGSDHYPLIVDLAFEP